MDFFNETLVYLMYPFVILQRAFLHFTKINLVSKKKKFIKFRNYQGFLFFFYSKSLQIAYQSLSIRNLQDENYARKKKKNNNNKKIKKITFK